MLDVAETTARSAGDTSLSVSSPSNIGRRDLLILPFKITPSAQVLMIWSDDEWRLPGARRRRGLTAHASAALDARMEASIAGRVFKRAIVCELGDRRVRIYPFLVREVLPAQGLTRGWAAPQTVSAMIGADLAPLSAFLDKLGAPPAPRGRHRT
jgi:hypothetical protein